MCHCLGNKLILNDHNFLMQAINSSSESIDGIGVNFPSEEAMKRSTSSPSTHDALEQARIDRTNDVRERLGPLINRLKCSMTNIQILENSMRLSVDEDGDSRGDSEMNEKDKGVRKVWSQENSRKLMNMNMEMVKRKMFRLKIMEEELVASEDRRVNLHHHFQQQVVPQAKKSPTAKQMCNSEYQNRITDLEEDIVALRVQNVRLLEKTKIIERLENELEDEKSLRGILEANLREHQYKMNHQTVKYDKLESQFEILTSTIANLTKVLQAQEHYNLNLGQEIMETMALHRQYLSNSGSPPKTIEHLRANESVTLTEPMTLSWTGSSISNHTSIVANDDISADGGSPGSKKDTSSQSTIQILRAKIESLDNKNAELRESNSHTLGRYKSLCEEMTRQSSMIKDRHKLDCSVLEGGELH